MYYRNHIPPLLFRTCSPAIWPTFSLELSYITTSKLFCGSLDVGHTPGKQVVHVHFVTSKHSCWPWNIW